MKAILIRHASSTAQAQDAHLTEDGLAQAEALVPVLTALRVGPLYTSPFVRAQMTISPYAQATGQKVSALEALRERRLAPEDRPDWMEHIRASFEDRDYALEGGESLHGVRIRVGRALQQVETMGGARPAIVSHGGVISALFSACDPAFRF